MEAVEVIRSLYQPLAQITQSLLDTLFLSGSEAYSGSLLFNNSIKNAMKSRIQEAEVIYNDLFARFPGQPRKAEADTASFPVN